MLAHVSVPRLDDLRGLLIDLDGVVFLGTQPLPGAAAFLSRARRHGLPFLLVTNNSTTSPALVARKLEGMGIEAHPEDILTSAEAAAAFVRAATPEPTRVFLVGEAGLREAAVEQGLTVVEDGAPADWVIAGLDRHFDYGKLAAATRAIRAGARFVATNTDALLPVEGGLVLPGAGSIVAALQTASGAEPIVVGKPEPGLFQRGLQRLGNLAPAQAAMVGDRIDTDVLGGRQAGLKTVLVLTGVTSPAAARASRIQPDATVESLAHLGEVLGWSERPE